MPHVRGPRPGDSSELMVYRELRQQLPDDWWVLTNVSWSLPRYEVRGGKSWVRDGQADFVVLAPGLGLLVLEVKGSRFVRVGEDGCWYRRPSESSAWERVDKSPPEQATSNAHQLVEHLKRRLGFPGVPCRFGYVVVYPQGEVVSGGLEMFDSSTVVTKTQIVDLRRRVRIALQARGPESQGAELTPDLARRIADVLMNGSLTIGPTDNASDAQADVKVIEQLTRQQFAALQGIFRHPRVAVSGPAGSGKTTLAVWRLAALIDEGLRAVYLCFNRSLSEYLRLRNPELASHIHNVDSYFAKLVAIRRDVPLEERARYFESELPGAVLDATASWREEDRLDAVIVDEGQDFGELRLMAVHELLKSEGCYLYCSDDRQDLYSRQARAAVGAEIVFSLVHNCRNTTKINETGNRLLEEHVKSMPGMPQGERTVVRHCPDRGSMAKAVWELVHGWIGPGSRVAVLSRFRIENSCVSENREGHGRHLVTELGQWDERGAVMFSTIKSFKGLEADAVIVVDVDSADGVGEGELYVACTRGRARLALLCGSEAARRRLAG